MTADPAVLSLGRHPEQSKGPASHPIPLVSSSTSDPDPLHAPAPLAGPDPSHAATPLCPHFGPCGGCQLQHLTYPAQLDHKRQRLTTLLAPLTPLPPLQTHTADPWQYRNRIRLRLEPEGQGFQVGYNYATSNRFLPIGTCLIAAPLLVRAALALAALPATHPAATAWLAATTELEFFCTPDEARLQLTLHLRAAPAIPAQQQPRAFAALCEALQQQVPELAGAGAVLLRAHHTNSPRNRSLAVTPTGAKRKEGTRFFTPAAWGSPGLAYPVPLSPQAPPTSLWVSRASFFQVNRFLLPTLVHLATSSLTTSRATSSPLGAPDAVGAARLPRPPRNPPADTDRPQSPPSPACQSQPSEAPDPPPTSPGALPIPLAWDLFAGVGLFTRALPAARLVAVESAPAATADLAAARLPHLTLHTETVLAFLQRAVFDRDRPSLVLLDPPRAGLGAEAAHLLTRLAPPHITYVSCDPDSLSRDLRLLLSSGYNLAELHLVDLFPQTVHQETVAVLTRS